MSPGPLPRRVYVLFDRSGTERGVDTHAAWLWVRGILKQGETGFSAELAWEDREYRLAWIRRMKKQGWRVTAYSRK